MGSALYRNYRPKSLTEVVGQEQIATTLQHALKTGKISHAYLFTGPRGVGKTSFARILAHEINGLPYDDDSTHLDIIEIDAASNRRIDEIRDLRDKVNIAPTSAKYKVYIIDEVHMLTREAFNALLKTLEEPPAHVVFILATTEVHKLPATIISRTQRFAFRPYPLEQVAAHLKSLAQKEKIDVDDEALQLIAAYGEGSFRDSISLLDQTRGHSGKVDAAYIRSLIGLPAEEAIAGLHSALRLHDAAATHQALAALRAQGFGAAQTAKQLGRHIRSQLVANTDVTEADFALLQKLLEVPAAHDTEAYLELILLEYALAPAIQAAAIAPPRPATRPADTPQKVVSEPSKPPAKIKPKPEPEETQKPEKTTEEPAEPAQKTTAAPSAADASEASPPQTAIDSAELWPQVLEALKKKYNTLYGVARMARVEPSADGIVLYLKFAFHQKRLSESKNHAIITDILKRLSGRDLTLQCELDTAETAAPPQNDATGNSNANPIAAISNIFGGAELLES